MLPSSLRSGWVCVADGDAFAFDGWFDGVAIRGSARVNGDTIELEVVPGKVLALPVDGFAHLFSTLMIAAHSR